jgi:hypothetical protein
MGYFAPWGRPFPPAYAPWIPPNADGVLGSRSGAPLQAYMIMRAAPPTPYAGLPDSVDHTAMLHQTMSNSNAAMYPPQQPDWFMDSWAPSHVTGKTGNLTTTHSSLDHLNSQHIIVGNGSKLPVLSVGNVLISSLPLYLQNVLVSPAIVKNLIFMSKFTRDNFVSIKLILLVSL